MTFQYLSHHYKLHYMNITTEDGDLVIETSTCICIGQINRFLWRNFVYIHLVIDISNYISLFCITYRISEAKLITLFLVKL